MHARTKPRPEPYVWATWISKLLAGEASCVWSAWFRAHHLFAKTERADFDLDRWALDHTAVVRRVAAEFEGDYTVKTERQNQFTLTGKVGTLAGCPDAVAVRGDEGWVIDGKTGQPRASDRAQVLLYLWALPRANPAYAGVRFRGRVKYPGGRHSLIEAEEVDAAFAARVADLMKVVCGPVEPRKAQSYKECQCCPLTREDCADRMETEAPAAGVTDEF
jgi:hypothetical protein